MKKLLALILTLVMIVSCACAMADSQYVVGVCQLMQHPALDLATQGFIDALNAQLPGQVTFDVQNASGESVNCATICNGFVAKQVNLIMANATPALTAAASATADIPILGTAVTAYGVALDIEGFVDTVGGNISGTSDLVSPVDQAAMIKEWFPDVKTIGMLFCSAEANSRYQVDIMTVALNDLGYTCVEYAFTDSNDLSAVTEKATADCDLLYIPTDNTAATYTEAIANVVFPAGQAVAAAEEGICSGCGVCTMSISYYDLGYTTGEMAAKVLTGEADISTMPVEFTTATKKYSAENCALLGITPVEGYTAIGQ